MTPTLSRLAYLSSATRRLAKDDLVALMRGSRQKNKRLEITGMLLVDDPLFLQVLEGPRQAVEDLFDVIRQDARHDNVTVIFQDHQVHEREFGQWLMGCKILGSGRPADYAELDDRVKRLLRHATSDNEIARELLNDFRKIESEYIEL